jgi:AcrR family transcriptional regulator
MARPTGDRFEQRKLTHQKLVDAALQLFSTSGYEHATVDDISQAAGYSKGAYYFHFSTKDDILIELLRIWTENRSEILNRTSAEDSGADAIRAQVEGFLSYQGAETWPGVLLEFWAQAARNAEVGKRLTAAYASWRRQIAETAARAAADGVAVGNPQELADLVITAHDGYAVHQAVGIGSTAGVTPHQLAEALLGSVAAAEQVAQRRAAAR